jgi:multiple sugar transport system permease protein
MKPETKADHARRTVHPSSRFTFDVSRLARHAAALLVSALFLLPLVFTLSASLRAPGQPPARTIEWIPDPIAWSNYARIFEIVPLGRFALNSLGVGAVAVPVTLLTASWAGYALAQLRQPWRGRLVAASIGLLLVPPTALWLPRFVLFTRLGLGEGYAPLLAPALMGTSPLFVLLFYWAARRIPGELFEQARLDGAGHWLAWRRVALPLSRATVLIVAILAFLVYWGDVISPWLYLRDPDLYTLPVGLQYLQQLDRTNWPLLLAAAVVMTVPAVALFGLAQRYFLSD